MTNLCHLNHKNDCFCQKGLSRDQGGGVRVGSKEDGPKGVSVWGGAVLPVWLVIGDKFLKFCQI